MPIEYRVDHEKKLIRTMGRGTITHEDVFGYQADVGARNDVTGYDELIDMSEVQHIALESSDRVRELASTSASMDGDSPVSKLAIIAPQDIAFGLGRMYATYREMETRSKKRVEVFRTAEEALAFLGLDS